MKNDRQSGSLFGLLARSYLLFAVVLLGLAAGVYALWNARMDELYSSADWDSLAADPRLAAGDYSPLTRYLAGDRSSFVVTDADGGVLFSSKYAPAGALTAGEIGCLAEYGREDYGDCTEFYVNGEREYRVVRYMLSGSGEAVDAAVTLDSDYNVVQDGLGDGRTRYTEREFAYLCAREPKGYSLYRRTFTGADGAVRYALFYTPDWDEAAFQKQYEASLRILLLFLPLALAAAAGFIWWLNRKIRRPLDHLNGAIIAQAEGRPGEAGSCGGPQEIRRIGESFDRLSGQLAESEAERRRLDEARQKLIADISHDLKTPITVIAGYADAICDGKVPPEEREHYLRAIQSKADSLAGLINAFHEYSRAEHPAFSLSRRRTELCEFCREYLAEKYDEIGLAGFTLQISIPEQPVFVQLDGFQFRRALDNLLSNSLRYNRLGTILFFDLAAQEKTAVLRVADNGIGIPAARRDTIFEPFVVGDDSRSGGGSGLGLAITRRIVEAHGGTIVLASPPSEGRSTEFILKLPRIS